MRQTTNGKNNNNSCSCEACGRVFESSIKLTNLSAMPMQTYDACPFCFSKIDNGATLRDSSDLMSALKEPNSAPEKSQRPMENSKQVKCPHHFGYLKKRPKNTPIPDVCLTCQKMIQCLL
jgi:hypothetical protein